MKKLILAIALVSSPLAAKSLELNPYIGKSDVMLLAENFEAAQALAKYVCKSHPTPMVNANIKKFKKIKASAQKNGDHKQWWNIGANRFALTNGKIYGSRMSKGDCAMMDRMMGEDQKKLIDAMSRDNRLMD
ncbi:hypothetical protein ABXV18_27140 [Vibrio owensii]|uniref:hypothetical protein n=1 Tax=Vibrio owensii TaxID=696485 RepID=UPI0033952168